jgi:hypothetical protein
MPSPTAEPHLDEDANLAALGAVVEADLGLACPYDA